MRYGSKEHKRQWLRPLMDGEIRSAFLMTEPAVASSDATNVEMPASTRDGDRLCDQRHANGGRRASGDPRCKIAIVMGKTDFNAPKRHAQQSHGARCRSTRRGSPS